jgi:hypothetical protein
VTERDDRDRWYRRRGHHGEGALHVRSETGDTADRDISWRTESGSLLDLHIETGGAYGFEEFSDPDQLEHCRECGGAIGPERLPRDDDGLVIRGKGGQPEYCSARCYHDRRNRKRRNRRARKSGKRVLSSVSGRYGVLSGQQSTGPQERVSTGEVAPWTVPCWAADPWLKFVVTGTVPIGRGSHINYSDPTGDTAARFVDDPTQRDYPDPTEGIPVGKREQT